MKRDEIIAKWDAMKPRERDVWVAEAVFGYTIGRERRINGLLFVYKNVGIRQSLPYYTTDLSAAWTVFELNGTYGNVGYMGDEYYCEMWARWDENGSGVDVIVGGNSGPEAICLAALIAKLTEVADV
jgi:hypothetical protein